MSDPRPILEDERSGLAGADAVGAHDVSVMRWAFVASACFFLLVAHGLPKVSDEVSMMELARSMLYDASFEVPDLPLVGVPGRDGVLVSKYALGQPVLSMPFDVLGSLAAAPLDEPQRLRNAITTAVVPLASALLVAWSYLLARRIGGRPRDALGVACCAVAGSFVVVYATEYFAEPVVALFLVVTVERVVVDRWAHAYAALAIAMVVHARAAPLVVVLAFVVLRRAGLRAAALNAWPVAIAVVLQVAYNLGRFGDPLETGYVGEGFTTPLDEGLVGLFFTTSKSVFLFAPLAVAGCVALPRLHRQHEAAAQLIGGFSVIVLVLTATWHSWYGGWSWGPRFLAPVVPLLVVALAPWLSADRRRWGGVLVLAVVGFCVSLPALIAPSTVQLGRPVIGPGIVEQYESVPDVVRSGQSGKCETPEQRDRLHCMPALWQVQVGQSVGPVGDALVLVATFGLLAGGVVATRSTLGTVSAAESIA